MSSSVWKRWRHVSLRLWDWLFWKWLVFLIFAFQKMIWYFSTTTDCDPGGKNIECLNGGTCDVTSSLNRFHYQNGSYVEAYAQCTCVRFADQIFIKLNHSSGPFILSFINIWGISGLRKRDKNSKSSFGNIQNMSRNLDSGKFIESPKPKNPKIPAWKFFLIGYGDKISFLIQKQFLTLNSFFWSSVYWLLWWPMWKLRLQSKSLWK